MKLGRSKHNFGRRSFHEYENANAHSVLKFSFQSYIVLQKKCFYKHHFNFTFFHFFQGSFNHKKICDIFSLKYHLSTKLKFN